MSDSVRPHRRQPTRLHHPWDSPGKNTGVGCHFLLQCMKVKSESEGAQSCLTLSDPMDCSPPGSSVHGIFQARVLELGAIAFSESDRVIRAKRDSFFCSLSWYKLFTSEKHPSRPSCTVPDLFTWVRGFPGLSSLWVFFSFSSTFVLKEECY